MADSYSNWKVPPGASYGYSAVVTASDTADLATVPRALWVGSSGDVSVILLGDTGTTGTVLKNVPAGTLIKIRPQRVMATGTNATGIVGLW